MLCIYAHTACFPIERQTFRALGKKISLYPELRGKGDKRWGEREGEKRGRFVGILRERNIARGREIPPPPPK